MLTILMGRARTGKTDWILRKIKELGDSSRQILLVPEHASHAAEMDLCAFCGDTASRHAEVLSFRRLATRVLSLTGGLADVTLDNGGKLLTLQKALCEVAQGLLQRQQLAEGPVRGGTGAEALPTPLQKGGVPAGSAVSVR